MKFGGKTAIILKNELWKGEMLSLRTKHSTAFWARYLLCGALIGAGAILPGVSGGVLAVAFDLYRPFMEILTAPRKAIPKYWSIFPPLAAGWAVGFLVFAKGIALCLDRSATVTSWLFIGLIAGTVPSLFREAGKEGRSTSSWASLWICGAAVFAGLYYVSHILSVKVEPNFWWYSFCGALWGLGVVVPGMTSSSVMMALGLYQPMLDGLASFDWTVLLGSLPGMFLTMILLARGVSWFFRTHYAVAFHGIVGIVLASTLAIVPLHYRGWGEAFLSILCAIGGCALALLLDRLDKH